MSSRLASFASALRRCIVAVILSSLLAVPAAAATVVRVVSSSGIEAWLVREPSSAAIALNFAFRGGASQDPADKPGVANMVARLLTEGAGELDARSFQERVQAEAIELHFSADRDRLTGSLRTLVHHRAAAAELLRLALMAARFDPADLERVRIEERALRRHERGDPNAVAFQRFLATAFAGHPYGRAIRGTFETVSSTSADDLRAYVRKVFARDTLKLAIVGNLDAQEAALLVEDAFGGLPASAAPDPVPAVVPGGAGRTILADLDAPQSVAVIGGAALARRDPDYLAALALTEVLGGDMPSSRLFNEVRERRGLAYSIRSMLVPMTYSAMFTICTATRADRMDQTLEVVRAELRRLAADGPTEDELTEAKAVLKGSFALAFDSSSELAEELVAMQFDDLGIDYVDQYGRLIDGIRLEDVRRVAKRLFQDRPLLAIAGPSGGSGPY